MITFNCENIASTVSGSVGEMRAPKYKVSRKVKLEPRDAGISCTQPYIREPMTKADSAVPTIANVRIAPRLRKKYFCENILLFNFSFIYVAFSCFLSLLLHCFLWWFYEAIVTPIILAQYYLLRFPLSSTYMTYNVNLYKNKGDLAMNVPNL